MKKTEETSQHIPSESPIQAESSSAARANPDKSDQPGPLHMAEDTLRKALLSAAPASDGPGWIMTLRKQGERATYLEALWVIFGPVFRHEHLDGERWPASMLSSLCADALQAGIEVDYVTQLIGQRSLRPDGPCVHWPWPMRVYTLGRFSLVKDGQAVTFSGKKSPRKPLELLQALIALGGREVHTSLLMRALWPDDGSRDLRKSFDNTLHRLRQIFGHEDAVTLRDAKLTLDIHHCWVDAWAFDHMAGRLCDGEEVPQQLAHDARRLYQGHFLQREAAEPWLLPYRERLRSRFHRFILSQGERLEMAGHWESAGRMYEQAIEIDNLAEILYRRLMVCLLNRGEVAEALRVYRRCRELLSIVLGVKPSLETEAIRRRL